MSGMGYIQAIKFFAGKSLDLAHFGRLLYWYKASIKQYTKTVYEKNSQSFKSFDDIDCSGRHFMVTGATSDIGQTICEYIVKKEGTTLHAVCHEKISSEALSQKLKPITCSKSNLIFHVVDLSEPLQVQKFINDFIRGKKPLNIHCASILNKCEMMNSNNLETGFALNVIGTYLFLTHFPGYMTMNTESKIKNRFISCACGDVFTVNIHAKNPELKNYPFKPLLHFSHQKKQSAFQTQYFSNKYPAVQFSIACPGWVDTVGWKNKYSNFIWLNKTELRTPAQGADTLLWLAISDEAILFKSGEFFLDRKIINLSYFHIPNTIKELIAPMYFTEMDNIVDKCLSSSGKAENLPILQKNHEESQTKESEKKTQEPEQERESKQITKST
ncbi:hypothetical protein HZS_4293 [Henneguya salminicola]|nr:hypothetical protein HZS_4293 [Henneguya salminicola]